MDCLIRGSFTIYGLLARCDLAIHRYDKPEI